MSNQLSTDPEAYRARIDAALQQITGSPTALRTGRADIFELEATNLRECLDVVGAGVLTPANAMDLDRRTNELEQAAVAFVEADEDPVVRSLEQANRLLPVTLEFNPGHQFVGPLAAIARDYELHRFDVPMREEFSELRWDELSRSQQKRWIKKHSHFGLFLDSFPIGVPMALFAFLCWPLVVAGPSFLPIFGLASLVLAAWSVKRASKVRTLEDDLLFSEPTLGLRVQLERVLECGREHGVDLDEVAAFLTEALDAFDDLRRTNPGRYKFNHPLHEQIAAACARLEAAVGNQVIEQELKVRELPASLKSELSGPHA